MDLVDSFLEEASSKQTQRAYRTDLRRFFKEEDVTEFQVQAISPESIQSFVRVMYQKNLSQSTQYRRLSALRSFFDWLIREGVLSHNPARHPKVEPVCPDTDRPAETILQKNEVEELVAAAGKSSQSGIRDRTLILTILYAALRRGEVANLEVDDVRPLGRHWILDLQTDMNESGYVRIPEIVVEAIEQVKERYGIASGRLWRSLSNRNYGSPMSPDAIYKVVRRVSEETGLEPVSIDALRRTGLHLALQGGADLPQVQTHGRLRDAASAARLHDEEKRSGALDDSAVDYIDLNVPDLPPDT